MNISLILSNKCFTKGAYFPEGLLSREGLLFSIYGIREKRKVEKQGVCVFLLFTVYIVHVVYKTDTCSLDNDFVSSDGNLEVSVSSRRSAYLFTDRRQD